MVVLRSRREIAGLRRAGHLVAKVFGDVCPLVHAGAGLDEIDRFVEDFLLSEDAGLPYKAYQPSPDTPPFPGSICTSVNEQVVHGFPTSRKLKSGDVVGIDVGSVLDGWIGDACFTFPVGEVSLRARRLLEVSQECLLAGVAEVKPGKRLGDVGAAIQELAEYHGYGVVRELGGHGIGRKLHEEPHVNHFGRRGRGLRFQKGMAFTIEPMINEGTPGIQLLDDGWTVVTADGKLSSQYEYSVAVTDSGCEILTPWRGRMVADSDSGGK